MLNKVTRKRLEDLAYDLTIGCGMGEEFALHGVEPGEREADRLMNVLGRLPTEEEWRFFKAEWRTCLQSAASP